MKTLLRCPADRPDVAALTAGGPLATLPILGKSLIGVWLEHLAKMGATDVLVLAADRADEMRRHVADGTRWGLRVKVLAESHELTRPEAFLKYRSDNRYGWLPEPCAINLVEHLPLLPKVRLFKSYRGYFQGLSAWLAQRARDSRVGVREVSPQVFVGLRARVAPTARLVAPCWIGEGARVGDGALVGPGSIIEDRARVGRGCDVAHSLIGPETLLGDWTEVNDSIAWGSLLINWRSGSWINVPDPFLCGPLGAPARSGQAGSWTGRSLAAALLALTMPCAALAILKARCQGRRAFQTRLAVMPHPRPTLGSQTVRYSELVGAKGILRRWPQLWNVARGDFAWLGHRPLGASEAARLSNDFDRLRLAWPLGLFSMGDDAELSRGESSNSEEVSRAAPGRVHENGPTLCVSGLTELSAANAPALGDQCARALASHHTRIDVNLSDTVFLDASGVGTLLWLQQRASRHGGHVRLLDPRPEARQFLELTRMHRLVQIADTVQPAAPEFHRSLAPALPRSR